MISKVLMIGLILVPGLLARSAFADLPDASSIPDDASLFYQVSETDGAGSDIPSLVDKALGDIELQDAAQKTELNCQAIYYQWKSDTSSYCDREEGWGPGGCYNPFNLLFGGSHWETTGHSVTVDAYCEPRSYDQKIIFSLEQRCEANPLPECLDDKVESAIKNLKPTLHYNVDKP